MPFNVSLPTTPLAASHNFGQIEGVRHVFSPSKISNGPLATPLIPRGAVAGPFTDDSLWMMEDWSSMIFRDQLSPPTSPNHQSSLMIPSAIPAGKSHEFTIFYLVFTIWTIALMKDD